MYNRSPNFVENMLNRMGNRTWRRNVLSAPYGTHIVKSESYETMVPKELQVEWASGSIVQSEIQGRGKVIMTLEAKTRVDESSDVDIHPRLPLPHWPENHQEFPS